MRRTMRARPSPAIVVAILALVAALAGTAVAEQATTSKQKPVTKKKVKKIAKKQVNKLAPGIAQEQIEALAVLNEDLIRVNESLAFGEQRLLAQNGPVSLTADCNADNGAGQNRIRILAATTQDGAFMDGSDDHNGPGGATPTFLNVGTPADDRELLKNSTDIVGLADVDNDIDDGFVAGPEGSYIGLDGETVALGLNAFGANCSVKGTIILIP